MSPVLHGVRDRNASIPYRSPEELEQRRKQLRNHEIKRFAFDMIIPWIAVLPLLLIAALMAMCGK